MKTLCIIPVYNEYNKLKNLIDQIKKNNYEVYNLQYLFVNNGSSDKSLEIIKKSKINYLNLKKNKGVGYALILGFLYGKKYGFTHLVHMAGNGKMKPSDIKFLINLILNDNYNFVSGSRFLKGSTRKDNPFHRLILIKSFSFILSFFLKKKITDASCGFRAFKIDIFPNFKKNFFKSHLFTYGYEYFSYGKVVSSNKIKYSEVPVGMDYPSKKDYSKIRPFIDWYIIAKYWLKGLLDKNDL